MKLTIPITLILITGTGCISRYYWGANLHSDGAALLRPVPRRLDNELSGFSQNCIEKLLNQDIAGVEELASADLRQKLERTRLSENLKEIQSKYVFSGKYQQINSTGGGWWLDEMINADPYRIYDFFITEYKLRGKIDAHLFLVIKKEPDHFSLLGFDIHSAAHEGENPDLALMPTGLKGWDWFGRKVQRRNR